MACRAGQPGGGRQSWNGGEDQADPLFRRLCRRQFLPRNRLEIADAGIGTAALKSYDGEFLLPTPESIAAAAAALGARTPPDERLTLVNAPGANAYPLVNYEYAVVSTKQANPAIAAALRRFLLWAIAPDETNEKYFADAHFIPLPAHTWVLSHDQIETIK